MEISKLRRSTGRQGGFALVETMIAISILAVGLIGVAALLAQLAGNSTTSRYMSTEALLASEKLDDLNRYPYKDPAIAVPGGNTAGSLTADTTATVTANNLPPEVVDYFDQVRISSGNGSVSETVLGKNAGTGNAEYSTTTHAPDGSITLSKSASAPAATSDMITFSRRWVIELSPSGVPAGVRRFTVLVSLQSTPVPAIFQASMLR
jgi:Tfp pilus assembly protein PilV